MISGLVKARIILSKESMMIHAFVWHETAQISLSFISLFSSFFLHKLLLHYFTFDEFMRYFIHMFLDKYVFKDIRIISLFLQQKRNYIL